MAKEVIDIGIKSGYGSQGVHLMAALLRGVGVQTSYDRKDGLLEIGESEKEKPVEKPVEEPVTREYVQKKMKESEYTIRRIPYVGCTPGSGYETGNHLSYVVIHLGQPEIYSATQVSKSWMLVFLDEDENQPLFKEQNDTMPKPAVLGFAETMPEAVKILRQHAVGR